jgi:multidrug efflux pump subunit AcrB
MEIEEKIILEVEKQLQEIKGIEEIKTLQKVNNLFVYQSVKLTEKDREFKESINYIENKLYDIIK